VIRPLRKEEVVPEPAPVPPTTIDGLLTDAGGLVDRTLHAEPAAVSRTARALMLSIIAGAASFGAAVGFYRGGIQVLYAAIKLPLVVLLTAVVSVPALTALAAALGRPADPRRDQLLVLTALARGALVLAALAPVMLLASCLSLDYHRSVLLLVGCGATAGLTALPVLFWPLWAERRGRFFLIAAMAVVVALTATQASWLFRPYLVRPRTTSVPFLRSLDGSFTDSVSRSSSAAGGIYRERP
jgi:hypothetical protein